ncbi:hypothetical protein Goklo_008025, partial [Gossypium klotzschianum]|nr:hypothetical protein [Gossypium klotzschianum]
VTLSGLLNFIDGLWSSCGNERIIIFTTNHKEKLDPALLRPGRMDVHIHMGYCTPTGFRKLATTYLGIKDDKLFGPIDDLIKVVEVTPAEVAQQLMIKSDDPEAALHGLITYLNTKKDKVGEDVIQQEEEAKDENDKNDGNQTKEPDEIKTVTKKVHGCEDKPSDVGDKSIDSPMVEFVSFRDKLVGQHSMGNDGKNNEKDDIILEDGDIRMEIINETLNKIYVFMKSLQSIPLIDLANDYYPKVEYEALPNLRFNDGYYGHVKEGCPTLNSIDENKEITRIQQL